MSGSVVFIPVKENSERVKGKNSQVLAGKPLYKHIFDKLEASKIFDDVYVDTDSQELKDYARGCGFSVINRPNHLTQSWVNGNDLLRFEYNEFLKEKMSCDWIFHLHVTAPFLKIKTIKAVKDFLVSSVDYTSVFTVNIKHGWYWHNNSPVNYNPMMPTSESRTEIVKETNGMYGVWSKVFESTGCRLGDKPYSFYVDDIEALDFNTEEDFLYAEFLHKKNKLKEYL